MKYKLTQEQRTIVAKNEHLIYSFVKLKNLSLSDTYGYLAEGLCNAVVNYNPDIGCKFSRYAYKCMQFSLYHYFKNLDKHNKECSLNENIRIDDDNCSTQKIDMLPDYSDYNILEVKEAYNKLISNMNINQKKIFNTYLIFVDVRGILNRSQNTIMSTIRKKSKNVLNEMGYLIQ
jgi:DNA-directed RNA polymerase specialized sigma subunit